jgi:hypothetical protein
MEMRQPVQSQLRKLGLRFAGAALPFMFRPASVPGAIESWLSDLVVFLDLQVILYGLHPFGAASDRNRLIDFVLAPGVSTEPDHAILVGIDVDARQTAQMGSGQLGLDFGRYRRIFDVGFGM